MASNPRFLSVGVGGLTRLPRAPGAAGERQWRWQWALLPALLATTPAFYIEIIDPSNWLAEFLYALAGAAVLTALLHTAARTGDIAAHLRANLFDVALAAALLLAAALPPSAGSGFALGSRLVAAALTLLRLLWMLQPALRRDSLAWLLLLALAVLGVCGVGFWWLEPRAHTLGDGLWLAFTTAATVGYGDIVPSTPAAKIFAVFVVLLGFAVLSLVTAAIAAMWVESHERHIEHEILHDLHAQVRALRRDIAELRAEQRAGRADDVRR